MPDPAEQKGGGPARPAAPGDGFLRHSLGKGSSHPEFALGRLGWAKKLAFGVGLVVVAVVAWHLQRMRSGQWQVNDLTTFLPALLTSKSYALGLAFAVAAVLTAALTIRASIVKDTDAPCRRPFVAWTEGVTLFAIVAVVCTGLAWLGRPGFLTLKQRVVLLLLGIIPLYALRWWFDLHPRVSQGEEVDDGDEEQREKQGLGILRSLWKVFETAFVLATSLLLLSDIATPVSRFVMTALQGLLSGVAAGAAPAFIQPLAGQLGQFVAKHAVSAVTVYLFQFFGASVILGLTLKTVASIGADLRNAAQAAAHKAAPPAPDRIPRRAPSTKSFLSRAWAWFRHHILRRPKEPEPPLFEGPSHDWAKQVSERLNYVPGQGQGQSQPQVAVNWLPGPGSGDDKQMLNWQWVFGGGPPTPSQEEAFNRFDELWHFVQLRSFDAFGASADRRLEVSRHADLFIESPRSGIGLTTVLHACAIYAAAARGQRVLLLVADEDEKVAQRDRIVETLAKAEFNHLLKVGGLSPGELQRYLGPRGRHDYERKELPPEIIIATPDEYDAALLDGIYDDNRLRPFLLSIEVVIVDAWKKMTETLRWLVHLPFLLDKHRLALSAEGRMGQVVIGGRPVSGVAGGDAGPSIARQRVGLRLFGGDGMTGDRFIPLQPMRNPPIDALIITLGGTAREDEALRKLLAEIRSAVPDENVAYVRSDETAQELPVGVDCSPIDDLLDPLGGIQPGYFERNKVRWLVLPSRLSDEQRDGLYRRLNRIRPEHMTLLVFQSLEDKAGSESPRPQLPVFVSPESSALLVSHLFSILPVLRVDAPIRREKFARFGLNWDPHRLVEHSRAGHDAQASMQVSREWQLEWDGDLASLLQNAASDGPWPAIMVRRDLAADWKGTGLRWPLDEGICLDFDDDNHTIQKALVPSARINARYATWVTSRGLVLGINDLFLTEKFVHEFEEETSKGKILRRYHPIKIAPHRPTTLPATARRLEGSGSREGVGRDSAGVLIEAQEDLVVARAVPNKAVPGGRLSSPEEGDAYPELADVTTAVVLNDKVRMDGPYRVATSGQEWQEHVFRLVPTTESGPIESEEHLLGLVSRDGLQRLAVGGPISYPIETGVTMVVLGTVLPDGKEKELLQERFIGRWATDPKRDGNGESVARFWPLLTECFQAAVRECAPKLLDFCRIFAFHPVGSGPRSSDAPASTPDAAAADHAATGTEGQGFQPEHAVLLVLENPTTVGTALEALRTLLDDGYLRKHLLQRMLDRLEQRTSGIATDFVGPKGTQDDSDGAPPDPSGSPPSGAPGAESVESSSPADPEPKAPLRLRGKAAKGAPPPTPPSPAAKARVQAVRSLLSKMGLSVADGPVVEEAKPKVAPPPAPSELPVPPFTGTYSCGKCQTVYQVPSLAPGSATHSKCSCGAMLFYVVPSIDSGPLYPMQFITHAAWPGAARCPHPRGSKERLLAIWRDVASAMTYVRDHALHGGRDEVWHFSEESLRLKKGDCEDHSILLANWLLAEGFEARIALGDAKGSTFPGGGGGHAWVVVRLSGAEYHLESTAKNADPLAPVQDVESVWPGHTYVAEQQFDHQNFWTLKPASSSKAAAWLQKLTKAKPAVPSFWDEDHWDKGLFLRQGGGAAPAPAGPSQPGPSAPPEPPPPGENSQPPQS